MKPLRLHKDELGHTHVLRCRCDYNRDADFGFFGEENIEYASAEGESARAKKDPKLYCVDCKTLLYYIMAGARPSRNVLDALPWF